MCVYIFFFFLIKLSVLIWHLYRLYRLFSFSYLMVMRWPIEIFFRSVYIYTLYGVANLQLYRKNFWYFVDFLWYSMDRILLVDGISNLIGGRASFTSILIFFQFGTCLQYLITLLSILTFQERYEQKHCSFSSFSYRFQSDE